MSLLRLRQFLDSYDIRYVVISHSVAYTAGAIAALTHIPGKEVAKTVIVKIDDALAMAVVSASQHVDLELLKTATKAKTVRLAAEDEFKRQVPRLRNRCDAALWKSLRNEHVCRRGLVT